MIVTSAISRVIRYRMRRIEIRILNGCDFDGEAEYVILACEKYIGDPIVLTNPTTEQAEQQFENILNIAKEKIDSIPSFTQTVKQKVLSLFR